MHVIGKGLFCSSSLVCSNIWWVCISTVLHTYTYNHYRIKVSKAIYSLHPEFSSFIAIQIKLNCKPNKEAECVSPTGCILDDYQKIQCLQKLLTSQCLFLFLLYCTIKFKYIRMLLLCLFRSDSLYRNKNKWSIEVLRK